MKQTLKNPCCPAGGWPTHPSGNRRSARLGFCPLDPVETKIMARFATLGIGPRGALDTKALSPEILKGVQGEKQNKGQVKKPMASNFISTVL